jgi:hypothetical protein
MYQYLVVPFQGQAKGSLDGKAIAGVAHQLQDVINTTVAAGWEFVEVASVTIAVAPGCLGGLFGARSAFTTFEQVIFRKAA